MIENGSPLWAAVFSRHSPNALQMALFSALSLSALL